MKLLIIEIEKTVNYNFGIIGSVFVSGKLKDRIDKEFINKASLATGGNVNITNENEYHEKLNESHEKSKGFLSSKTTDIYDYSNISGVVSSNVSAGSVDIQSGRIQRQRQQRSS